MTLAQQLLDYVHAACSGLWLRTSEPDEAERDILQVARQQQWQVATWDIAQGLRLPLAPTAARPDPAAGDPLAALRALHALADPQGTTLLLLHQFHFFLKNPEVIQATINRLLAGKQQRTFLVVLSPLVALPVELEKLFVLLEHALPDR
ncbi:MAG: AAA family ATPase, partial [Planctomycetia bacterium]|nr:AAA family ATPase [Planctomycetia bacterium]